MNINDIYSSILSVFIEWGGFLVNNRFIRKAKVITWENRQENEFVDAITSSYIAELVEDGQYSFQVKKDGSIFQIYYSCNPSGKEIRTANLGFYYSGNHYYEQLIDEETFDDFLIPRPDINVGWLRIDYSNDPKDDGGSIHAKCHMHISLFPDTRIIVDRIPNPKQFVEFVIAICFPDEYKAKRLDHKGYFLDVSKMCNINDPLFPDIQISDLCEYMSHLHIPTKCVPPMEVESISPKRLKRIND